MRRWHWIAIAMLAVGSAAWLAFRRTLRATIEREEGNVRYVYKDSAGIDTFGIGHRVLPNERDLYQYSKSNPAPTAVVDAVFFNDVQSATRTVDAVGVPLSSNQRAALVSLVFNIGIGAFNESTLRKRLVARDYQAAADEMLRWKNAGGQPVLLARRERERDLFLTG